MPPPFSGDGKCAAPVVPELLYRLIAPTVGALLYPT